MIALAMMMRAFVIPAGAAEQQRAGSHQGGSRRAAIHECSRHHDRNGTAAVPLLEWMISRASSAKHIDHAPTFATSEKGRRRSTSGAIYILTEKCLDEHVVAAISWLEQFLPSIGHR